MGHATAADQNSAIILNRRLSLQPIEKELVIRAEQFADARLQTWFATK